MPCLVLLLILLLVPATAQAAPDRTKPTTPSSLRVVSVNGISATLAWNASSDNSGWWAYMLVDQTQGYEWYVPQTQTSYTASSLQPNRTYRFVVYAYDMAGNRSANSNQVTVTTPAAAPAAVPTGLRATAATPNSISLAWNASANAVRYELQPSGGRV